MNIFKATIFTLYEIGALKWSVLLIGIACGVTWPEIFSKYA